jgi:hypothetical protein
MMENNKIILYKLLGKSEEFPMVSGQDKPETVREKVKTALIANRTVEVDLANLRSLSPSFAYEAFGKLFDEFGEGVIERLVFTNDPRGLKSRIVNALQRRREILRPHN